MAASSALFQPKRETKPEVDNKPATFTASDMTGIAPLVESISQPFILMSSEEQKKITDLVQREQKTIEDLFKRYGHLGLPMSQLHLQLEDDIRSHVSLVIKQCWAYDSMILDNAKCNPPSYSVRHDTRRQITLSDYMHEQIHASLLDCFSEKRSHYQLLLNKLTELVSIIGILTAQAQENRKMKNLNQITASLSSLLRADPSAASSPPSKLPTTTTTVASPP